MEWKTEKVNCRYKDGEYGAAEGILAIERETVHLIWARDRRKREYVNTLLILYKEKDRLRGLNYTESGTGPQGREKVSVDFF